MVAAPPVGAVAAASFLEPPLVAAPLVGAVAASSACYEGRAVSLAIQLVHWEPPMVPHSLAAVVPLHWAAAWWVCWEWEERAWVGNRPDAGAPPSSLWELVAPFGPVAADGRSC